MRHSRSRTILAILAVVVLMSLSPVYVVLNAQGRSESGSARIAQLRPSAETEVTLDEVQLASDGKKRFRIDMSRPISKQTPERFYWSIDLRMREYTVLRLTEDDERDAKRISTVLSKRGGDHIELPQLRERLGRQRLESKKRSDDIRLKAAKSPRQVSTPDSEPCSSTAGDSEHVVHGPSVDSPDEQLWHTCSGFGSASIEVWELVKQLPWTGWIDHLNETWLQFSWNKDQQMFAPYGQFFSLGTLYSGCWANAMTFAGTSWFETWCPPPVHTPYFDGFDVQKTGQYINLDFPVRVLLWNEYIATLVTTTAGISYAYGQPHAGFSMNIDAASPLYEALLEWLLLDGVFDGEVYEYNCHYNCQPGPTTIWDCENGYMNEGIPGYWDELNCECVPAASPIIIDLDDNELSLTSPAQGVMFDILGRGTATQVAWTQAGTRDAFLVLDRNGNGAIDGAKELFGNFTDQPPPGKAKGGANGFLALEVFDQANAGGDDDKQITEDDAVYGQLRLWIDANHDGVSQPGELTSLGQEGIRAISLRYVLSKRADGFGNLLRYRSHVAMDRSTIDSGPMKRQAVDVMLRIER